LIVADDVACDVLVIGVGNDYRGDDGAGLLVARALFASGVAGMRVLELPGEGTELMDTWLGEKRVIVIDASKSGAEVGAIMRLDAIAAPLPAGFFNYSTHAFGLAEAVETSRNLGTLPEQLIIYAIEGSAFCQGDPLSAAVEEAVTSVVDRVLAKTPAGDI